MTHFTIDELQKKEHDWLWDDDAHELVDLAHGAFASALADPQHKWPADGSDPYSVVLGLLEWRHQPDLLWSSGSPLPTKVGVACARRAATPSMEPSLPGISGLRDFLVTVGGHPPPDPNQELFDELAQQWRMGTAVLSSTMDVAMHPSYQRIIGFGPAALPFILRDLRRAPDLWFWALVAITGEDPAAGVDQVEEAASAWIEWGYKRGYLH